MLGILIAKDFRRTLRNPWPWILNLALPLAITALIGFVFGGGAGRSGGDGDIKIKFAVVDEDKSFLSGALKSAFNQGESAQRLDPVFLDRTNALRTLRENEISAILIIPAHFSQSYLLSGTNLNLEVIKNPAQGYFPAIIEEMAAVAGTALNAIARNFTSELPKIRDATANNNWDFDRLSEATKVIMDRLKTARVYLNPPIVWYEKDVVEKQSSSVSATKPKGMIVTVFGFILPGMASAFLLFMADQSMRDFHREIRMKTFDRQRTVGASAGTYIASKIIFTALTVVVASGILFGGGSLIFGIAWGHPGLLALACAGYALFAAGFMALLSALAPSERRVEALNSILLFAFAFAGGSYLPSDNFPKFMREHVTTLMPNHWLIQTARALQDNTANYMGPLLVVAQLALLGVVLGVISAFVINRRLTAAPRA